MQGHSCEVLWVQGSCAPTHKEKCEYNIVFCELVVAWNFDTKLVDWVAVQVASSSSTGETEEIYFDFRKQRFIYSVEQDNFLKLRYPTKEPIGNYAKGTGFGTEAKINIAVDKWGRNM